MIFFKFFTFFKIPFFPKIQAITVQLLVELLEKFLQVIWNLSTKTYPEFLTLRLFLKNFENVLNSNGF